MLERLSGLRAERGALSSVIIDEASGMPSASAYSRRFGSLRRAYELIGYVTGHDYRFLEINRMLRRRPGRPLIR
jgi:hypothetical protein